MGANIGTRPDAATMARRLGQVCANEGVNVPLLQPMYDLLGGERVATSVALANYGAAVLVE